MKVLLDTNILISASMNNQGNPYLAFLKAVTAPNKCVVCTQNLNELERVYARKFPHKISLLEKFLNFAFEEIDIIEMPIRTLKEEIKIRDISDRPILRAAIIAKVEILVTGDKDFLDSTVIDPKIMTAVEFLRLA
ncbi:MAG: putative toxin-antitoxin system toxin component, PIN family [Bacteroidales bacterium]|jgi:putative PIN family toxin of toxin-antitoxin system|nr:putative toxin-antitoxin system toxin component, PIN family [Bacteroidales bacterium]